MEDIHSAVMEYNSELQLVGNAMEYHSKAGIVSNCLDRNNLSCTRNSNNFSFSGLQVMEIEFRPQLINIQILHKYPVILTGK